MRRKVSRWARGKSWLGCAFSARGSAAVEGWLQTALLPEHLEKSLRRIEERARLTMEEQGVDTLFIALGMLQYTESEASEQVFRAPLVLLPAILERKSARAAYIERC